MDFRRGIQNFARILRSKLQIRENRHDFREVKGVSQRCEKRPLKETPFSEDVRFSGCPLPSPNSKVGSLACKSVKMAVNLLKRNVQTNPSRAEKCATFKTQSLAKYSDFIKTGPIYHAGFGACQRIQPGVSRGVFIELP